MALPRGTELIDSKLISTQPASAAHVAGSTNPITTAPESRMAPERTATPKQPASYRPPPVLTLFNASQTLKGNQTLGG